MCIKNKKVVKSDNNFIDRWQPPQRLVVLAGAQILFFYQELQETECHFYHHSATLNEKKNCGRMTTFNYLIVDNC